MARVLTMLAPAATLCGAGLMSASPAAAGSASAGKAVFASQCSSCHSDAKSRPVVVGPPLFGVVGRPAGSIHGFAYSTAMKSAGFAWTPDRLRNYLPAPREYPVPARRPDRLSPDPALSRGPG
jgi:cytochrome c